MARNINLSGETPTISNPVGEPKDYFATIDKLAEELGECSAAAKREKEIRPQLLNAMVAAHCDARTTENGVTVKVVTTNKDSFDEEKAIEWAKANGHPELVKTITKEALDMEALEKLVYAEASEGEQPFTKMVEQFTTTTTTNSIRVTLPKKGA